MICRRCGSNLIENIECCENCKLCFSRNKNNYGLHFCEIDKYKNSKYKKISIYWNIKFNETSIWLNNGNGSGKKLHRFQLLPFDISVERIEKLILLK
jgi:hypothetical protein